MKILSDLFDLSSYWKNVYIWKVCMFAYINGCVPGASKAIRSSDPLELELGRVVSSHWVLGMELGPLHKHQVLSHLSHLVHPRVTFSLYIYLDVHFSQKFCIVLSV